MTRGRLHVVVTGLVHGVGFRHATYRKALSLGLTGWVRNLPDGRVESVMEGDGDTLRLMLDWCEEGPGLARVDSIEHSWEEPEGSFVEFAIVF